MRKGWRAVLNLLKRFPDITLRRYDDQIIFQYLPGGKHRNKKRTAGTKTTGEKS